MKVSLNLSASRSLRQRYALAWGLPVVVLGFLGLIRLTVSAASDFREYRSVRVSVEKEQDHLSQLRGGEAALRQKLEQPQYRELLREVQFVNALIDQKQLSMTELAAKITALLPPQVRLTSLSIPESSGDPLVRIGIEGMSEEQVENFVSNLEESSDFRDPVVNNQGFEQKGTAAGLEPVTITCTARYVGGRSHHG